MYVSHGDAALTRCLSPSRFSVRAGRIIVAGSREPERTELRSALESEGHQVTEAATPDQALREISSGFHDALILDSEFEKTEPWALCRAIRSKSDLGIIVVASHDTCQHRIDAFNSGADDYLPSPFLLRELLARVRAVLRRIMRSGDGGAEIVLQDRAIDFKSYKIKGPGSRVSHLTPKEYLVLRCLVTQANKSFTHQNLAQAVWQRDGEGGADYLRTVIRQLRKKLEVDPDNPRYILTERSVGYRFRMAPVESAASADFPPESRLAV